MTTEQIERLRELHKDFYNNYEQKIKELTDEANLYADDMSVPLEVSFELYEKIDRLKLAINRLRKRGRDDTKRL